MGGEGEAGLNPSKEGRREVNVPMPQEVAEGASGTREKFAGEDCESPLNKEALPHFSTLCK